MQFQIVDAGGNVVAQSAALPVQAEGSAARRRLQQAGGPFRAVAAFTPKAAGLPPGSFRVVVSFTPSGAFQPSQTSLNGAPVINVAAGAPPSCTVVCLSYVIRHERMPGGKAVFCVDSPCLPCLACGRTEQEGSNDRF